MKSNRLWPEWQRLKLGKSRKVDLGEQEVREVREVRIDTYLASESAMITECLVPQLIVREACPVDHHQDNFKGITTSEEDLQVPVPALHPEKPPGKMDTKRRNMMIEDMRVGLLHPREATLVHLAEV